MFGMPMMGMGGMGPMGMMGMGMGMGMMPPMGMPMGMPMHLGMPTPGRPSPNTEGMKLTNRCDARYARDGLL